jgi:hypothetical protein
MPKDNGNESFDGLEGLPEGVGEKLESFISRRFQSEWDKRNAAKPVEPKAQPVKSSEAPDTLLGRIERFVGQGLSFGEAREKAELEEMKEFYRNSKSSQAEKAVEEKPAGGSLDVSKYGLDPTSPAVQAVLAKDMDDLSRAIELGKLLAGGEYKSFEPPAKKTGEQPPNNQAILEAYISDMQEATSMPSGRRRMEMKAIKAKYAEMGLDVDKVSWSL